MTTRTIIVDFEQDSMGCLLLTPRNKRLCRAIARHLDFIHPDRKHYESDATAFIQVDYDVDAELERLPRGKAADVRAGWTVGVRYDAYDFLAGHIGWDAHEGVRSW